jgi:salicylate biosynthesis isochorismate synthase/menaquinone-specific isochorismate synthase
LLDSLERLARSAGDGPRRLISVTRPAGVEDPVAAAFASRRADDRWFCWQEPGRDFAVAGVGSVREVVSRGRDRVADLIADTTEFAAARLADEPDELPAGAGPLWVGGMAFAEDGGASHQWSSLPPALLVLPELLLATAAGERWLTISAVAGGGASPDRLTEAAAARLATIRESPLPPLDPHPTGGVEVQGTRPPAHYERAVAEAVARIRDGAMSKLVLAREVTVDAPSAHSPGALFGALRELFDSCFCFCVGTPEAAFVGASPELLVRRDGAGATAVALAGSARRSADPAVDDHLGEQLLRSAKDRAEHEIVASHIERRLARHSVWVEATPEPVVIKVANIQHLATPIRAQLAESRSVLELAGLLHPTPAVGCEPAGQRGREMIAELEEMDRGWYAGPVGWMDMAEDGEFCVALRSGLIRDRRAHLYAGAGIVADSDPAGELAETEVKLGALLPLLAS